jgi:hemoglobin/transferrin/lactoferrin receptor protein
MGNQSNDDYQRFHFVETSSFSDQMMVNDKPNVQKFSGYNQLNLLQKFRYRVNDKLNLNYAFHYSTSSNIPRYDRLIEYGSNDTLKYAEWYYGPQKWMMHNLSLEISDSTFFYDDIKLTLAYQMAEESRYDRKYESSSLRARTENVDIYTLNLDLDKVFSPRTTLFYGLEGFYNYVNSEGIKIDIQEKDTTQTSTRYPDGGSSYSTIAAYANLKSNLSKKLILQVGMRYSYVWLLSKFEDKSYFPFDYDDIKLNTGALNGSIGIVHRTNEKLNITSNLSSGFRAPNIDDIAKIFDSEPGNVVVPNSDLKPEYSYNIDLGATFALNERTHMNMTLFYTYLIDAMVRSDFSVNGMDSIYYDGELSKVQAIVNGATANIYGGSFSFLADLTDKFGFTTNLTYMKGEDEDHFPIRHVSPLFGRISITYTASKIKLDFYVNYNGQIKASDMALTEKQKPYMYASDTNGEPYSPSWYTINLKGYYQINEKLQLNLGVENMLNKRYRPYSSGIVAPGINFIAAIRASL